MKPREVEVSLLVINGSYQQRTFQKVDLTVFSIVMRAAADFIQTEHCVLVSVRLN